MNTLAVVEPRQPPHLPSLLRSPMAATSPRSKPRLSFDESAIQRLEEDKRRQSGGSGSVSEEVPVTSITTISGRLVPESILRRTSATNSNNGQKETTDEPRKQRPSLYSTGSHPSLQEDMCSEIARLDNVSERGGADASAEINDGKPSALRRLFQVTI